MKRHHRFWDRIANKYALQPVADETAYQEKLRKTREHLTPDSMVFEFGCGTGSTAVNHAPYARQIVAIDVSQKMIEIAKKKASSAEADNVRFEVATIDDYDVGDERFDVVMAHSILHLLEDKDKALAKSNEMLKPGGIFVSSTICLGDQFVSKLIRALVLPFSWLGVLPYLNQFSSEGLKDAIRKAGFTIEHEWRPKPNSALFLIARKH